MGQAWRELDVQADDLGLPMEWVACPICGEHSWRFPPHMLDPCPIAVQSAEAQGLKFDAERMAAVRAGIHLEELGRRMGDAMRQFGIDVEEEDEEL